MTARTLARPELLRTEELLRAEELVRADLDRVHRRTDRFFALLLALQYAIGVAVALVISPRTWIGSQSAIHVHVWAAVLLGGLLTVPPILFARQLPGQVLTRHVMAVAQMLWSALLIHLTGGRIETHFHVFGSMAFLAFYRDWRVLITATAVVATDHFVRGLWFPESVFGVLIASPYRWLEHAGWVAFENAFLVLSCVASRREVQALAARQAALEASHEQVEARVAKRTAALVRARDEIAAANRAKTEFLANMSHEIRTPMTGILGYVELLDDRDSSADQRREFLDIIRRNGEHLLEVINDVLDISKIESGQMTIEAVESSLQRVVGEVQSLMRIRAEGKGLVLRVESATPIPARVRTDPTRLRQILVNLIGNAIKFTEHGGVTMRLSCAPAVPRIRIDVIDTGVGMSAEQVSRVFEPFTQADTSTTRRFGGTGLGLAISRRLGHALGGDLEVASRPGAGSTFSLSFDPGPLDGVEMLHGTADAPVYRGEDRRRRTRRLAGRVLLAEDGPDNQRLIGLHLRRCGLTVEIASNGREAVDAAVAARDGGHPHDLILMDMQMPELDGYQATAALREAGFELPILALTAHAMAGDRERCLAAGCDDYLSKPIDARLLLGTIERHLGTH